MHTCARRSECRRHATPLTYTLRMRPRCSLGSLGSRGSLALLTQLACQPSTVGETDGTDSEGAEDSWDAPDCAALELPGPAEDVAATPRADRDAEVLALTLNSFAIAAPQDSYEIIAADLAAIRALDPTLETVHPTCEDANMLEVRFTDELDAYQAIWSGIYESWDCHNEHFGVHTVSRIEGTAFWLMYSGVFGAPIVEFYERLPGFESAEVARCVPGEACGFPCLETASSINIEIFEDNGAGARQYHFTRAEGAGETLTDRAGSRAGARRVNALE